MKIIFDHKFGAQEHVHLEHYSATLIDVADNEIDDALAQGWLTDLKSDGDYFWYQCRSTRCNLNKFHTLTPCINVSERQFTKNKKSIFYAMNPELDAKHTAEIYLQYCKYKNFTDLFHGEVSNWLECDYKMVYYDFNNPVAWSKMRMYTENALETVLFVWNYNNPKLRIGVNSLIHELNWAKSNNFKYVYLGPGYESGSIYKADIDGFEWWTGSEWSTNTVEYIRLCERDSKLKTIEQLSNI